VLFVTAAMKNKADEVMFQRFTIKIYQNPTAFLDLIVRWKHGFRKNCSQYSFEGDKKPTKLDATYRHSVDW
jgi:hypothetical protein